MQKEVLYHFVDMRKVIVPEECPTDSYDEMICWCQDHNIDPMEIKSDTRDWEIVSVERVDYDGQS